jgi:hypothetical protein
MKLPSDRTSVHGRSAQPYRLPFATAANSNNAWWLVCVGVLSTLLCLPFFRHVFWLGDEGILLHGADRMLHGQTLYNDFFEFYPPGGFVIVAAWFAAAGVSIWSTRVLAILAVAGIACFIYLTCRQVSKNPIISVLVAVGWVIASQGDWTAINHHYFATLFSMVVVWACLASIEKPARWLRGPVIAGLAGGAAGMITPTAGAFALLAAATALLDVWRSWPKFFAYVLATAIIPVCLIVYVLSQGAFAAAFDDVIVFTATRYSAVQWVPYGTQSNPRNLPLKFIFHLAALLTLAVCALDWRRALRDPTLRLCVAFAIAGFAGVFPRPDMIHIAFSAPMACPLVVYCLSRITNSWPRKYHYAIALAAIGLAIPSLVSYVDLAGQRLRTSTVQTSRGDLVFGHDSDRMLVEYIAATPADDKYFFYPYMPMLPFVTERQQVSKYEIFTPTYTTPSQYREACFSAMRDANWIVLDKDAMDPDYLRVIYPTIADADPPEKKGLESALRKEFAFVSTIGSYEIRRRTKPTDDRACAAILG